MGRYYWDKKNTVEESRSVSIAFLGKHDYFCGFRSGVISWTNCFGEQTSSIGVTVDTAEHDPHVRFQYTNMRRSTGEKTECDYKVILVSTPCNFGGVRWWFICPLTTNSVPCGRRVAKLYCPPGAIYYGCRHCYNLSYDSRNEPRLARPGATDHRLKVERQLEDLYQQTKRWTGGAFPKVPQSLGQLLRWPQLDQHGGGTSTVLVSAHCGKYGVDRVPEPLSFESPGALHRGRRRTNRTFAPSARS